MTKFIKSSCVTACALLTGFVIGLGEANAQSVGDMINLVGQVANIAQTANGNGNPQSQPPVQQNQQQAQPQRTQPQAQQQQVDPAAAEREAKVRNAKIAHGKTLHGKDLIVWKNNPSVVGSCERIASIVWQRGIVDQQEGMKFMKYLEAFRYSGQDSLDRVRAQFSNVNIDDASMANNKQAFYDAYVSCRRVFK